MLNINVYLIKKVKKKINMLLREKKLKQLIKKFNKEECYITIEQDEKINQNQISSYWTEHTVHDGWFVSAEESLKYREWVFDAYPKYREFADMDRSHEGEVILDYGCGPGNDLTWYTQRANPRLIIGMDISLSALKNSQFRMALHQVSKSRCRLIQIDESKAKIPLEDNSVDFVSCQGVLMCTSFPEKILNEFCRVLRPVKDGEKNNACVMIYNRDSIWYHLYVAYYLRFINSTILQKYSLEDVQKMQMDEIFRISTDGIGCPVCVCWLPDDFSKMCKDAGFRKVDYQGGYPADFELKMMKEYLDIALKDDRLEDEHKAFLKDVTVDLEGYPMRNGVYCGIGGVYRLWR